MHKCQISLIIHGVITDIACGKPANHYCRIMCIHEHASEGWVCPRHIDALNLNICRPCFRADGHTCPLGLTETTTDDHTEKLRSEPADQ